MAKWLKLRTDHQDGFPGHPPDGEEAAGLALEVVGAVTGSAHTEVRNFYGLAASYETVPEKMHSTV